MKDNSKAIASMLHKDTLLIVAFLIGVVGISCFVLFQTLAIVESGSVKALIVGVFAVTMLVLGSAMAWVTMHLRKNKDEVYGEDLYYQDLIRQQKEGRQ